MKIIPMEEIISIMFLETCISKLESSNILSGSNREKINKLNIIKDKFIDEKIKMFLENEN